MKKRVYKKKVTKIGNANGIYLPTKVVNDLDLNNTYVKLYENYQTIIIERLKDINNLNDNEYLKRIKKSGSCYKFVIPKKILENLETNYFKITIKNNRILIKKAI
jgi:antitoxin component of MazEF toxin-antitoxin module